MDRKNIQQIINDIQRKDYNLERVNENEIDPSKKKTVKKLLKKIRKEKGESTKNRMLTFFKLGKKLGDDQINEGNKYDKNLA